MSVQPNTGHWLIYDRVERRNLAPRYRSKVLALSDAAALNGVSETNRFVVLPVSQAEKAEAQQHDGR